MAIDEFFGWVTIMFVGYCCGKVIEILLEEKLK